jgi:hypothetical protein
VRLRRENDALKTTTVCLRREIENQQGAVGRLELLLRERIERIDELNGRIEQLRNQNRRLDEENEHLVEMMRLPRELPSGPGVGVPTTPVRWRP